MIIKIEGNNDYVFPDSLSVEDRLAAVELMLKETVIFYDGEMTIVDYFHETFNKDKTRSNLEKIGFYLSKMPDQNGRHDKEILSRNDEMEMQKGVRWKTIKGERVLIESRYKNFADLNKDEQVELGMLEPTVNDLA